MVGPVQITLPGSARDGKNVRWFGPVSRDATTGFYREADVFVFPTFSDGFGLTQLEAQACRLPVIASRNCGEVVRDGVNGLLLPEVTAEAIEAAFRRCLAAPDMLAQFSQRAVALRDFGLEPLAAHLRSLEDR